MCGAPRQAIEEGRDETVHLRLVIVMEASLARAKLHAEHIEGRIADAKREPERQRRRAAARRSPLPGQFPSG